MAGSTNPCIFCQIARSSTSTHLLHSDDRVVAFPDINPSAFRHYLVIPIEHIPTVKNLRRRIEDYQLVSHMLDVGRNLLRKDAPESKLYRYLSGSLRFDSPEPFAKQICFMKEGLPSLLRSCGPHQSWKNGFTASLL